MFFINESKGWAAGYDGIIGTANGGTTWTTQLSNSPYRLIAIRFTDENYGWANAGLKVFRTENGGTTWHDMAGIDPNAIIFRNVIFPVSQNVAWATAQGGGTRWFYKYTATSATTVTEQTYGLIASSTQLLDLWFTDVNNGWAVGLGGQIWKIGDANTDTPTFTNQTTAAATQNTLRGVFFLDSSHGWAVGDGGALISTSNGGTTWSAFASGTTTNLRDVHFVDLNHGTVVGENGLIMNTDNGGTSWTTQASGVTTTLFSIFYSGGAPGFIAGGDLATSTNGVMLRSDIPLNVNQEQNDELSLSFLQNYPNPFSVSTEINYFVPLSSKITLALFDISGRRIDMLREGFHERGLYNLNYNPHDLNSGIYFLNLLSERDGTNKTIRLIKE